MTHTTITEEIIPADMPDWAVSAFHEGRFFIRALEKVERLTAELLDAKESCSATDDKYLDSHAELLIMRGKRDVWKAELFKLLARIARGSAIDTRETMAKAEAAAESVKLSDMTVAGTHRCNKS